MESPATANISGVFSDMSGNGAITHDRHAEEIRGLVDKAKAGDKHAFGALYRTYHPSVYRLARFYLDGAAEDAAAEAFVRAWKALPRYKDRGVPFKAWLYAIARHVVTDELRRRHRTEPRERLPEGSIEPAGESNVDLARAIARLPKQQRQVIEMKYFIGMTNPEVARILKKTPNAVNALQWRALRAMREALEERS